MVAATEKVNSNQAKTSKEGVGALSGRSKLEEYGDILWVQISHLSLFPNQFPDKDSWTTIDYFGVHLQNLQN